MTSEIELPQQGPHPEPDAPQTPFKLKKLNDRHKMAAHLCIAGMRDQEICRQLYWTREAFSRIKADPIFRTYKSELEKEFRENSIADLSSKVAGAAASTFKTINEIMEQGESERNRLTAAGMMFDRQMPKVNKNENNNTVSIKMEGLEDVFKHMLEATGVKQVSSGVLEDQLEEIERAIDVEPDGDK